MAVEPTIRPYQPPDLPAVLEVLRAALGETAILRRTPELWAWKHERNPFGPSLMLVAELEERIAGVRALMRWDLKLPEGETLRCLRAVDTATHPDFERRGIFRKLTGAAVEQARADGYDLIFNTPNDRSGAGYLTMGWGVVGPIGVMVRPLLRRGVPVDPAAPPQAEAFFSTALPVLEPAEGKDRPAQGLRTPRSAAYLAWRFNAHPYVPYRAVEDGTSLAVLRPNLRRGYKEVVVSDILGDARPAIIRAVSRRARAAYLAGWFTPGTPERRASVRGGLIAIPKVRSLTLVANPLRDLPVDVFQPTRWDLAMSDLELL